MTIWVTGTVGNILHETEKTKLFIVTTDEGERLVMSARKGDGIEVEAGATSTFECDLYAVPRTIQAATRYSGTIKVLGAGCRARPLLKGA